MQVLSCPVPQRDWATAGNGILFASGLRPVERGAEAPHSLPHPWKPAIQEIVTYQHLEDNWDCGGAKAPSRELLESAIGLAYCFLGKGVPPPHRVVPGVDGSVVFEWQDPDGTYSEVEIVRPFFAEVMVVEPGKPAQQWTLPTA